MTEEKQQQDRRRCLLQGEVDVKRLMKTLMTLKKSWKAKKESTWLI